MASALQESMTRTALARLDGALRAEVAGLGTRLDGGVAALSRRLEEEVADTQARASLFFFVVLGLPHVSLIELRLAALIPYQDYHVLFSHAGAAWQ